jgi:hypothetical protein
MPWGRAVVALAFVGIAVSGCAKAPTAEIEAADAALTAAVTAESEDYAPATLASVRDLRAQLEAELTLQSEKFALTRNYDHALELANQVKTGAEQAATEAASTKEVVRQETAVLVETVKTALQEAQTMLTRAPRGKGSAMDLAALQGDLDTAAVAITEGEAAFAEGKFAQAKSKFEAAQAGIDSVKTAIETAIQARTIR